MTNMIVRTWDEAGYEHRTAVQLSDEQAASYLAYRKACKFCGVEPTLADFLAGDIPSCVTADIELTKRMTQPRAFAATA